MSSGIRVLSPRMEPPRVAEDGSTATTATRCPASIKNMPKFSMNVDLPAPGGPAMPMRKLVRLFARVSARTCPMRRTASSRWRGSVDSTRVMDRLSDARSPEQTASARDVTGGGLLLDALLGVPGSICARILDLPTSPSRGSARIKAGDGREAAQAIFSVFIIIGSPNPAPPSTAGSGCRRSPKV